MYYQMSLQLIGVILEGTSPWCKQEIAAGRGMRRGMQLDFLKKQTCHPRANGLLLILPELMRRQAQAMTTKA